MFDFTKKTGDPSILLAALEKLAKACKPGNYHLDGVDIGKVAHDALKKYKG